MMTPDDGCPIEHGVPPLELVAEWLGLDPAYFQATHVDQDHDGIYEHVRWQIPIEHFPEQLLADPNWNGVPDGNTRLVDLDGDGIYETHLNPMDLDHDGQVDHWVGYTGAPHGEFADEDTVVDNLVWDNSALSTAMPSAMNDTGPLFPFSEGVIIPIQDQPFELAGSEGFLSDTID